MNDIIDLLKPDTTAEIIGLCLAAAVALALLGVLAYVATKLRSVTASQGRVEAQFANNGGSTLKDAVDRLERDLAAHTAESAGVHSAIFERLDGTPVG